MEARCHARRGTALGASSSCCRTSGKMWTVCRRRTARRSRRIQSTTMRTPTWQPAETSGRMMMARRGHAVRQSRRICRSRTRCLIVQNRSRRTPTMTACYPSLALSLVEDKAGRHAAAEALLKPAPSRLELALVFLKITTHSPPAVGSTLLAMLFAHAFAAQLRGAGLLAPAITPKLRLRSVKSRLHLSGQKSQDPSHPPTFLTPASLPPASVGSTLSGILFSLFPPRPSRLISRLHQHVRPVLLITPPFSMSFRRVCCRLKT